MTIGEQIHNLYNKDIDPLKFAAVIKKALKNLKALLNLITTFKKSTENTKIDEANKLSTANDGKN